MGAVWTTHLLLTLMLFMSSANCQVAKAQISELVIGTWSFPRYTKFAENYVPSVSLRTDVHLIHGANFYFTFSYQLCNGSTISQNAVAVPSPTSSTFKWLNLGCDGLAEKSVCVIRDITFSRTGRVGRGYSTCFYAEFCAVRGGVPLESVEIELNELCPLGQFKVPPTRCGDDSSEVQS